MSTTQQLMLLDGGMSRELIRVKAPFRQPEWSALALIESPDLVELVHKEFAVAGADVLTTNSYALVPFHIGEQRFHDQGEALASLAGRLARKAADEHNKLVAGSLPPIFGSYEPEKFRPESAQDYLSVLVRGLEPSVDIWLGETLSLIAEAEAVLQAVRSSPKPVWIAFTIRDDEHTKELQPALRSGESIETVAQWALTAEIEALLFNCSQPERMDMAVKVASDAFKRHASARRVAPRLGVYANAFEPVAGTEKANEGISKTRDELDAQRYADHAIRWIGEGASIIGGCCGIGCEHIAGLHSRTKLRPETQK